MNTNQAVVEYRCPQCQHTDQVVKISTLFSKETTQGRYSGLGVGASSWTGAWAGRFALSGSQQTVLAKQLVPPAQPKAAATWGVWSVLFLGVTVLAITLTIIAGLLLLVNPPHDPSILQGAASLLALTIFCILITIVLLVRRSRSRRESAQAQMLQWERAMRLWERFYYCGRNDLVFLPEDPRVCFPPSDMKTKLTQRSSGTVVV